ncbi:MAG TPA: L-seryl-tRNA(Sec) selenium transferase, partial [Fimbriimonadaceae bacterium]|nr:L-seryl-tRNA(Sec) selenium transferase [Fimbriimonadaceae bacterium]
PKVDTLSRALDLAGFSEAIRVAAARQAIDEMRQAIRSGQGDMGLKPEERARAIAEKMQRASLRPAINLTGVILHTGLGRARMAEAVADHVRAIAAGHSTLEIEAETGKRGNRQEHVRSLLIELTGAEDAFVVNNGAAAVVLALSALAKGREVILSRGQMVEIGGSFRMPDIVRESGCRLIEVGCTNKTRIEDYESAMGSETAAILRCHTSNFKIVGFTEQPSLPDLVRLAHAYGVLCIDDMGTGCLKDLSPYRLFDVPTLRDSMEAGAEVVVSSGDKLLGGPQAGLILGRTASLDKMKRHPLARAFRVDKLSLAALEATLRLYVERRESEIRSIAYLERPLEEVRKLAGKIAECIDGSLLEEGITEVGGGSAPGIGIPTWRVGIPAKDAEAFLKKLREADIFGRIEDGRVWLDPRTLEESELQQVCEVLRSI